MIHDTLKKDVKLAGAIVGQRMHRTKNGDRVMFAQLEDLTGSVELIVFSGVLKRYSYCLLHSVPVIVEGYVDINDDGEKTAVVKQIDKKILF